MRATSLVPFAFVPLALLGCAAEPLATTASTIDLTLVAKDRAIRGVSLHDDNLDVLVDGALLTVSRSGALLAERFPGEHGLWQADYKDVVHLGEERFILLADPEGYLYDAVTEQQSVHFCVEPDMEPEEPVVTQRNDAVAASDNLIVAAPRFYQDGVLVESSLRTYFAGSGEPISSVDMIDMQLELRGLALDGDEILGVQGGDLYRFSTDGEHLSTTALDGVVDASGIAVDGQTILVTDALAPVVRIYQL